MARPFYFGYHLKEKQVTDSALSTVGFQIVKSVVDNGIIVSHYLEHRRSFPLCKSPSKGFYVFIRDYMLETGMIEPYTKDLLTQYLADFKGYIDGNQQLVQEPRTFFCCIHRCFRLEDELAAMEARAVQESMDESVPRLIAATQEAIQALQITEVEVGCDDPCMICLAELEPSTTVIKRMPCCSHLFHGDCIEQWLNTSHLCPWCRFPMPTSLKKTNLPSNS